ncbi:hypothetical protein NDU88_005260 [Pleurodeles waltl]|uniref:Uncharacterized protein n=1 Tax=Pleurodeles waltl TaxID=8319 RepID=A0AAV7SLB5_PLEWA|nr:hypothetical protein NDU88_005260 [Pleurodeles waltl]
MPPSPHMSQLTVPMKDNSEHRVKQLRCQRPLEKRYLACHRQGRPDPGGLPQTEHPLQEKMGGQSPLEQEDGGGSAGDGLPMWVGCPSHHDPPDVQDPGGGLPGVGWAFEGITAATRGVSVTPPPKIHKRRHTPTQQSSTSRQPPAYAPSPKVTKRTPPTTTTSSSTPKPPPATRPSVSKKLLLSNLDLFPTPPTPRPSHRSRTSTSATTSLGSVVPVVTGIWSAPATRAASVARSHSTDSPPPVKHQKLASARRERGKTSATKATPRGPVGSVESAVTPSKVGKGHKKPGKSGKSSTAEKTAIIPDAQEATASISPAAEEAIVSISPAAQEATGSISPAGP